MGILDNIDNIDVEEIKRFSTLADQWWDPQGPCAPLHILNPVRLEFIKLHTKLSNKKVLDIGCGAGILTESLIKEGSIVTGIDASEQVIKTAMQHAKNSNLNLKNIKYFSGSVEDFIKNNFNNINNTSEDNKFDIITCMELLEHVPDPKLLITACKKLIKPNGKLFFSTLHRTPKSFLYAIIGAEYIFKILPKKTHDYHKFIRPSELHEILRQHNIDLLQLSGVSFNPLLKTAKLSLDVSVNYLAYARNEDFYAA